MPNDPFYRSSAWRKARASRLQLDGHRCTVPDCHATAVVVDHCNPAKPRSLDPRDLRSLCRLHDNQVKEGADGTRRSGGQFKIIGTDADGWPLDPKRR
jgi:hypothetical protein